MSRSPNAVPGALNIRSLTGDETIAMQGGPREAQATARQVAAAPLGVGLLEGTAWTFILSNANGTYNITDDSGAITLTVPEHVDVPFPAGASIILEQGGTGQFTLVGDGSVVLNSANGLKSSAQFAVVTLLQTSTDVWTVFGSTST